jgi:hypothetical protein
MVSRPVHLGIGPPLRLMTRFLNVFVFNHFLSSSCRAPSLTIGRVCNLQCNNALGRVAQESSPYTTVSSKTPPTSKSKTNLRTLWQKVGRSVSMSWCRAHSGTCDQILLPVGRCCLVSVGRPLWREDGSAVCSAITQWTESHRTRNHTLLSHLKLPQHGGSRSHIYIPQEQGGPVITFGHWVPFTSPLTTRSAKVVF